MSKKSKQSKQIPIKNGNVKELCCFCRKATEFWTAIKQRRVHEQVACCTPCSATFRQLDVPSKKFWFLVDEKIKSASANGFASGRKSIGKTSGAVKDNAVTVDGGDAVTATPYMMDSAHRGAGP